MKRNILAVLLCAAMLVLVSSCGGGSQSDADDPNLWNPEIRQRAEMQKSNVMCGVLYLGYAEADMLDLEGSRSYYDNMMSILKKQKK